MASFVGTNKEFRRYIGPRLRNLVQHITKNHKASVGACEHCSAKENLESAHIKDRDRNQIIDLVLKEYINSDIITVNIAVFEEKFKSYHNPIEESILILCRSCHRKYDSKQSVSVEGANQLLNTKNDTQAFFQQADKNGHLPITLEPADVSLFKKQLLLSKKAEIQTYYSDKRSENKYWNASKFSATSDVMCNLRSRPEYRSGKWQSLGILKVHVRVIKNIQ